MFRFNHHHQGAYYLSFAKFIVIKIINEKSSIADLTKYAATPPNQPRRCILTDYFNNYNFSKAQTIRSLMMVIKLKYVRNVLI
jgi:hypothetical protein